jgi:hypothetical protein
LLSPFVRRVLNRDELQHAIELLRKQLNERFSTTDESEEAESARSRLIDAIGDLADNYRKLIRPDTFQIEAKLKWIFKVYWSDSTNTSRGLPEDVRNMLISGEFVWSDFQGSTVEDWAACAVQYVRAIERELYRRLYLRCGSSAYLVNKQGYPLTSHEFTFGTVKFAFDKRKHNNPNWNTFVQRAVQPSKANYATFESVIADIVSLHKLRNDIAHSRTIEESQATLVQMTALGDSDTGHEGALPRFVALLDA